MSVPHCATDEGAVMSRCEGDDSRSVGHVAAAGPGSVREHRVVPRKRTNTWDYYDLLAEVGSGSWRPDRDARPWIRFVLTARYRQAQTLTIRVQESERRWSMIEHEVEARGVPERAIAALFNAPLGFRIQNATFRDLAGGVSDDTAGRDPKALVEAGLLVAIGERRGRHYRAAPTLQEIHARACAGRRRIEDPFQAAPIPQTLGL